MTERHTHPEPEYDPEYCSCCRKRFIHGLDNVVAIRKRPEGVYSTSGEFLGTQGPDRMKAAYHAECFQKFHAPQPMVVECKYCGVFAMAKKLADGSLNECKCSCHSGNAFCSLLVL